MTWRFNMRINILNLLGTYWGSQFNFSEYNEKGGTLFLYYTIMYVKTGLILKQIIKTFVSEGNILYTFSPNRSFQLDCQFRFFP